MSRPDQVDIWALTDLCTPWCVHVVATLRIADHIAAGITQIDDLATASGSVADSLHRVLRHLVGKGMFEEPAPAGFRSTSPRVACWIRLHVWVLISMALAVGWRTLGPACLLPFAQARRLIIRCSAFLFGRICRPIPMSRQVSTR